MTTPPVELVVLVVGVVCLILGGVGTWWCWAVPAIADAKEAAQLDAVAEFALMTPAQLREYADLFERRSGAA